MHLLLLLHLRVWRQSVSLALRVVALWCTRAWMGLPLLHTMLMHVMMMRVDMWLLSLLLSRWSRHRVASHRTAMTLRDWRMCGDDRSRRSSVDTHLRIHTRVSSLVMNLLRLSLRRMWRALEWSSVTLHLLLGQWTAVFRSHRGYWLRTAVMPLSRAMLLRQTMLHTLHLLSIKLSQVSHMRT